MALTEPLRPRRLRSRPVAAPPATLRVPGPEVAEVRRNGRSEVVTWLVADP